MRETLDICRLPALFYLAAIPAWALYFLGKSEQRLTHPIRRSVKAAIISALVVAVIFMLEP